jgi:AraC-like DNA-binding protein
MDLVFTLDCDARAHSHLCGARSESLLIDTSKPFSAIGVRFKPGGGFPFFSVPAGELHNVSVPLEAVWGSSAAAVTEQVWSAQSPEARFTVLERALLERMNQTERHPAVGYALDEIRNSQGGCAIATLTDSIGLSARRFIEVFRNEVGLAPKLFCRIRRFNEVLLMLDHTPELDWTEIAIGGGYFDQAHFIHDFRAFSGVSPSVYFQRRTSRHHISART